MIVPATSRVIVTARIVDLGRVGKAVGVRTDGVTDIGEAGLIHLLQVDPVGDGHVRQVHTGRREPTADYSGLWIGGLDRPVGSAKELDIARCTEGRAHSRLRFCSFQIS
jgi:hypothetical protein